MRLLLSSTALRLFLLLMLLQSLLLIPLVRVRVPVAPAPLLNPSTPHPRCCYCRRPPTPVWRARPASGRGARCAGGTPCAAAPPRPCPCPRPPRRRTAEGNMSREIAPVQRERGKSQGERRTCPTWSSSQAVPGGAGPTPRKSKMRRYCASGSRWMCSATTTSRFARSGNTCVRHKRGDDAAGCVAECRQHGGQGRTWRKRSIWSM
jgi:hypothetical protein